VNHEHLIRIRKHTKIYYFVIKRTVKLNPPKVTVIIPTFNSEKTIACCLQSMKNQSYPNLEIIIVDKYSSDETLKISEKFNVKILLKGPERSAQKNWGAANADSPFLLFVDSDMELTPKVIEECVNISLKKGADAVIIPQVSISEGFWSECRKIERDSFIGNKLLEAPRFFKKEVFDSVGGFDETISFGEDSDLYLRIKMKGYKILRARSKIKHYEGELSLKRVILKAYHYGKTLPVFIRKHPFFALKKHSPLHQIYISNVKLFFKDSIHFLGIVFIKLLEYISYSIGIFSYLIFKK